MVTMISPPPPVKCRRKKYKTPETVWRISLVLNTRVGWRAYGNPVWCNTCQAWHLNRNG